MKKRKTPILLVSILVVFIGGVVVFGMSHSSTAAPTPDDTQQKLEPNQAPSADIMAKNIKQSTSGGPDKGMQPDRARPRATGPTITINADPVMPKPKPNPNGTTDSQWYDKG